MQVENPNEPTGQQLVCGQSCHPNNKRRSTHAPETRGGGEAPTLTVVRCASTTPLKMIPQDQRVGVRAPGPPARGFSPEGVSPGCTRTRATSMPVTG